MRHLFLFDLWFQRFTQPYGAGTFFGTFLSTLAAGKSSDRPPTMKAAIAKTASAAPPIAESNIKIAVVRVMPIASTAAPKRRQGSSTKERQTVRLVPELASGHLCAMIGPDGNRSVLANPHHRRSPGSREAKTLAA
jgi:hypothetical protein